MKKRGEVFGGVCGRLVGERVRAGTAGEAAESEMLRAYTPDSLRALQPRQLLLLPRRQDAVQLGI